MVSKKVNICNSADPNDPIAITKPLLAANENLFLELIEMNSLTPTTNMINNDADAEAEADRVLGNGHQWKWNKKKIRNKNKTQDKSDNDSLVDIIFGSCTGGVLSAKNIFHQCKGKVKEGYRSTNFKEDDRLNQVGVPYIVRKARKTDTHFEYDAANCADSISAISACTLDEMAHDHHPRFVNVPSKGDLRESPAATFYPFRLNKGRSNATESSRQQSLAETSGSSSAGEIKVNGKVKRTMEKIKSTETENNAPLQTIQQHDTSMSERNISRHN